MKIQYLMLTSFVDLFGGGIYLNWWMLSEQSHILNLVEVIVLSFGLINGF
jgi:hypothetical protein